jgi:ribosomal protein S18 acetylase RimI-like enzyme
MSTITIRIAQIEDAEKVHDALCQLSIDLGDQHRATLAHVIQHGFGENSKFTAVLAEQETTPVGVSAFSPIFSTTQGGPGIYISDLWVSRSLRGKGLGKKLIIESDKAAVQIWGSTFIKLSVYRNNLDAIATYKHFGFEAIEGETTMLLPEQSLNQLKKDL